MSELTIQDVRALKNADRIVAHAYIDNDGNRDVCLRAILDASHSSTGYEQEHRIACKEAWERYDDTDADTGFAHLSSAKFRPTVSTFVRSLRAGDSLTLKWIVGNNNQTLTEAGLAHDEFYVVVHRPTKAGRYVVNTYWLDSVIAPKGSTARLATRRGALV